MAQPQEPTEVNRNLPGDACSLYSRRPALERGDREERHHSRKDIVEVEITVLPDPLPDHRAINIPILVEDEEPPGEEKKCGSPWPDMTSGMPAPVPAVSAVMGSASQATDLSMAQSVFLLFSPCP